MQARNNLKKCLPYQQFLKFFAIITIILAVVSLFTIFLVKMAIKIWRLDYRLVMVMLLFYLLVVIFYSYLVIFKWKKAKIEIINENVNYLKKIYYPLSKDEYMPYFIQKEIISRKGSLLYSLDGESKEEISFDDVTIELQYKVVDGFIYLFLLIKDLDDKSSLSMYELNNEWFNYLCDNQLMNDCDEFKLLQSDLPHFVVSAFKGKR